MAVGQEYIVGIDLGTTNCAVSTISIADSSRNGLKVENTPILQISGPGQVSGHLLLPSFLYQLGGPELPEGCWSLPWDLGNPPLIGKFARDQGARVPGRLVSSAKSWLVHKDVDREAAILPWGSPSEIPHISPLDASTAYLRHLAQAWNWFRKQHGSDARLEDQIVIITVPASFDDSARMLTRKAAKLAGISNLTLIEEPQAAFYCWMMESGPNINLKPGEVVAVIDIGGGTTDFTLIEAVEDRGEISLVRRAVGDHLLLGGDNMDMVLARNLEAGLLDRGSRLDPVQFQQLIQQCRHGKEILLGDNSPEAVPLTIQGRGRSLVAGTLKAELTRDQVLDLIGNGFFPSVGKNEFPAKSSASGLREFGLPFVSDPGVTRHLAHFFNSHGIASEGPDAILFNGGVFQSETLRNKVSRQIGAWFPSRTKPNCRILATSSLDLAVARGAAHFGWVRHTGGRRIGGGIARSYYLELADEENKQQTKFICVLPQKAEEGIEIAINRPVLNLAVGIPVRFQLYSSTVRPKDTAGLKMALNKDSLLPMPEIQTILRGGKRMGAREVAVTLVSKVNELGTLELACAEVGGSNRWILEFNLRPLSSQTLADSLEESHAGAGGASGWPQDLVESAKERICSTFSNAGDSGAGELVRILESILGAPKAEWPLSLCRSLSDELIKVSEHRRKSPSHLSRWLNLTGWCLRPGTGDPNDAFRIDRLWKSIHAPVAGGTIRSGETGIEAWIMMRRIAAGLNSNLQNAIWTRLKVFLIPAKGRSVIKPQPQELQEMWRCAASMERLGATVKLEMGEMLMKPLLRGPCPAHVYWCLGRLGGRWPNHGPWNTVVSQAISEKWIDTLLPFPPVNPLDYQAWLLALTQLARRTGQRGNDVSESHQKSVTSVLNSGGASSELIRMVTEVTEINNEQAGRILGDELPLGLKVSG